MVSVDKVKKRVENQSDSREFVWLAQQLFQNGNAADALVVVNKGLQYFEDDLAGKILQAKIKLSLGDLDHSKQLWEDLFNKYPSQLISSKNLMEIALQENDLEGSRRYFNHIKSVDPLFSINHEVETPEIDVTDVSIEEEINPELTAPELSEEVKENEPELSLPDLELNTDASLDFSAEVPSEAEELNLSIDEDMQLDSDAVGDALDDIFGEENDEFNLDSSSQGNPEATESIEVTQDESAPESLELPLNQNESAPLEFQAPTSETQVVELPKLELEDDDEFDFGSDPEPELPGLVENEPIAEALPPTQVQVEEDKEEVVTGTDVSDALDEIFGELEEDEFDESLLGASDQERVVPSANNPNDISKDNTETSVSTDEAQDIFEDSEEVLDQIIETKAHESELNLESTEVSESQEEESHDESLILKEPEQDPAPSALAEDLGDAVVSELDALFEEEDEDEPEDKSSFTQGDYDLENDDTFGEFEPVQEETNSAIDELETLEEANDEIFGEFDESESSSNEFYNIEGEEANNGLDDSALDGLDLDDEIDESIFEDPTAPQAEDVVERPTVTLAEIYFGQELFDRSLKMYQELAEADPQDEKLKLRIEEIKKHMDELDSSK